MHNESFLITNNGKRCPVIGHSAFSSSGSGRAVSDAVDHAVREKGWIGVDFSEAREEIKLTFRAMDMAEEAVTAACALLLIPKLKSVVLKYDFHGWTFEKHLDGSSASLRVMEIAQSAEQLRRRSEFFAAAKDPEILFREKGEEARRLSNLLRTWRESAGVFSAKTIPLLREFGLLSRTLLIEPSDGKGSGKFTFIGDDFTVYGKSWPQEGIGQPVEHQFDSGYGIWVAKALAVIRESGMPQYEHVDARIRRPNGEYRRSRYKCLRTLWRDNNNHPILMTNSLISQNVDIPLMPVQSSVV
ncbi:hypothetical protein [Denitrobaculum tricleocarpae]|uniref:Uncharacterized protein n=1 Tax=Denitrobaculum tricleocarpae TaxID=2591009 RepID=A0A545TQ17_9PROT|nr:hypothetical protein [Denitrobaculum tricleocarpae]TQV79231.1 hypothetical protein FKG95_16370 [Denitrobaculum tricleocarpae]